MKFTQDHAFETLKSELTNKGRKTLRMSEKSLSVLVETLMPQIADDEMGLDEFVEKVKPIVSAFNSNVEGDQSKFIKKWKEDHPEPAQPQAPSNQEANDDSRIKAFEERIAALEADKKATELKASLAQKRSDIMAKLKEKGVNDSDWVQKFLSKVNLTPDSDVEAEVNDLLPLFNQYRANGGEPFAPINPTGGSPDISTSMKDVSELAKQRNEMQGF